MTQHQCMQIDTQKSLCYQWYQRDRERENLELTFPQKKAGDSVTWKTQPWCISKGQAFVIVLARERQWQKTDSQALTKKQKQYLKGIHKGK